MSQKRVYLFGNGKAEGNAKMREELVSACIEIAFILSKMRYLWKWMCFFY